MNNCSAVVFDYNIGCITVDCMKERWTINDGRWWTSKPTCDDVTPVYFKINLSMFVCSFIYEPNDAVSSLQCQHMSHDRTTTIMNEELWIEKKLNWKVHLENILDYSTHHCISCANLLYFNWLFFQYMITFKVQVATFKDRLSICIRHQGQPSLSCSAVVVVARKYLLYQKEALSPHQGQAWSPPRVESQ